MKELKDLLGIGRAFWDSQVLLTAINLNIFDQLENYSTANSLAKKIKADSRAMRMLLDALTSLNFIEKRSDKYRLKEKYAPYLISKSDKNILSILRHYSNMWNDWGNLPRAVKTGKPFDSRKKDKEESYHFINGMDNLTKFYKKNIIEKIDFKEAKKILDIGSGPATYLREMLNINKNLKAVILDLPSATFVAREKIEQEGLSDRVSFIEGGLQEKDFGKGYELILISQVLHSLSRELGRTAIEKSYGALKKGGKLYIHEFYLNEKRSYPKDNVVFCLNMLLHSNGGDNYTVNELKTLIESQPFKISKIIKFKKPPTVLIEAITLRGG